jgi:hypothetical protein
VPPTLEQEIFLNIPQTMSESSVGLAQTAPEGHAAVADSQSLLGQMISRQRIIESPAAAGPI